MTMHIILPVCVALILSTFIVRPVDGQQSKMYKMTTAFPASITTPDEHMKRILADAAAVGNANASTIAFNTRDGDRFESLVLAGFLILNHFYSLTYEN